MSDGRWNRVRAAVQRARDSGALQPIATREQFLVDGDIRFVVRVVDTLKRKPRARRRTGRGAGNNPFLPYEELLFVEDAGPGHVCLLNKFPVVDQHVLIVTRQFEEQTSQLHTADFQALWPWLQSEAALGFYNAGVEAGASQPHKHLQVVPLPLASEGPAIPIEPLLAGGSCGEREQQATVGLPFRHQFTRFGGSIASTDRIGEVERDYRRMLDQLELFADSRGRLPPYNLLITREWMLMVPRSTESFDSISVNALGFAGALLVSDEGEADRLRQAGPIRVLRHVTA